MDDGTGQMSLDNGNCQATTVSRLRKVCEPGTEDKWAISPSLGPSVLFATWLIREWVGWFPRPGYGRYLCTWPRHR
jgi:hypothetical protein